MATFGKHNQKWLARIRVNHKYYFIGYFVSREEAERRECQVLEEILYGDDQIPKVG